jgi:fibronectin-binding autotransporter adhesin
MTVGRLARAFGFVIGLICAVGSSRIALGQLPPRIITGNGTDLPVVKRFTPAGAVDATFFAYPPTFTGGVRVAAGDVNGDGTADIITGTGPGSAGGHVKAFDGLTQAEVRSFLAYPGFSGGVFVASGDVNGDGRPDIITGTDSGAAGHVKAFSGDDLSLLASFFAYPTAFTDGVRVAAGDVNGDGRADIVTGAGSAGNGHVKVFDGLTNAEVRSFFAYGGGFTGGVYVAAGDVNGDTFADLLVGTDSGPSHVKVFSGADNSELYSFFAYDVSFTGGVRVAAGDLNGDGRADIITGAGPGGPAHVKVFSGLDGALMGSFLAEGAGFTGGIFVGAAVPEPSELTMIGLTICTMLRRRARARG